MSTQTNTETAYAMYAEEFGEKAAKRNGRRIEVLAGFLASKSAYSEITLEEVSTDLTGSMELSREEGVCILGKTNATTTRVNVVIARFTPRYAPDGEEITRVSLEEFAALAPVAAATATQTPASAPVRKSTMRGQLWEECYCRTEPVCATCQNCDRHCTCGGAPASSVAGEIYGGDQSN